MVMVKLTTTIISLILIQMGAMAAEGMDQYGTQYSTSDLKGQVTVVDFAASWCKPCWKALPKLEDLSKEFPQLKIIVLSVDSKVVGRDRLVKELNLSIPVVWDGNHEWAKLFKPRGMPTTLILDEQGQIIYQHEGASKKSWQNFLEKLKKTMTREN